MAITFTPKSGTAFTIGGVASVPTGTGGVAGPFANFSIAKEVRRQDSLMLGAKWTINITGTALITSAASHLTKGVRQAALFALSKQLIFGNIDLQGKLEIDAYDGTTAIDFNNATLISVDAGEQDEASGGTQNQPYTFTFESYDGDGNLNPEPGKGDSAIKWIESFSESWDVQVQDGEYQSIDAGGTNYKSYSISHSLNAQAVLGSQDSSTEMSWLKAKAFVEQRLVDTPLTADILKDERKDVFTLEVPTGYTTYNHVRQRGQSIADGSYEVTDTWIATKYPASHTAEYSFNLDPSAEFNTVEVSVTAQGVDSKHPETSNTQDKYAKALLNWETVKTAAKVGAVAFYNLMTPDPPAPAPVWAFSLRTTPSSTSESHNKTDGSLSYNATFDDAVINYPNAVSESLSVTYDNVEANNNIVVIIPVLAKADGPVIQDMATTNEKVVSVSLDLQMAREHRASKPGDPVGDPPVDTTDPTDIVNAYKPTGVTDGPFQRTKAENWNPYNGSYNLSIEWVYI